MYSVGDKIVYPMHGDCIIDGIEEKEILGEKEEYYILRFPFGKMRVMVPIKKVDEVGIREIISKEEIEDVVRVLKGDQTKMPSNWNRRYRYNMDKIRSGDIYQVADVVRNLMIRDRDKGLSTAERKLLTNAKRILVSEIALSKDAEEQDVIDLVDKVTLEESV